MATAIERNMALFSELRGVTVRNTFLEFEGDNDVSEHAFARQASEPAKPFHRQVSEQTTTGSGISADKFEDQYQEMDEAYPHLPYPCNSAISPTPNTWASGMNNCSTGMIAPFEAPPPALIEHEYQQMQKPLSPAKGPSIGFFGTTPPVQSVDKQARRNVSDRQRYVEEVANLLNSNPSMSIGGQTRIGQAVPQTMAPVMAFCPNCGAEVDASHRFCPYCCFQLRGAQQSVPQQAAPPQRHVQMMPTQMELVGPVQMPQMPFVGQSTQNSPPMLQQQPPQNMSQLQMGQPMLGNGPQMANILNCLRHFRYIEAAPHEVDRARKLAENFIRVGCAN